MHSASQEPVRCLAVAGGERIPHLASNRGRVDRLDAVLSARAALAARLKATLGQPLSLGPLVATDLHQNSLSLVMGRGTFHHGLSDSTGIDVRRTLYRRSRRR